MTKPVVISANSPDYWPEVRRRAARRKAMAEAKAAFDNTPTGMIYEKWVADLMDAVSIAARNAGFRDDAAQYQIFRQECADLWSLPEIASEDAAALRAEAARAIDDAVAQLCGQSRE